MNLAETSECPAVRLNRHQRPASAQPAVGGSSRSLRRKHVQRRFIHFRRWQVRCRTFVEHLWLVLVDR